MKRKKTLLFSLILFCISAVNAQLDSDLVGSRDTIFLYDTLVIIDTIRISRPPIDFKDLEKLSTKELSYLEVKNAHSNEKLFIFSNGQTATLLDSNIKSVNNNFNSKNSDEMKKIGFLGVMLFAFQNMILAQNDVGIYLGSGAYNLLVAEEENTNFVPTVHIGLSYQKPFAKNKLFYDVKLNYSHLSPTRFNSIDSISYSFRELSTVDVTLTGQTTTTTTESTTTIFTEATTTDYSCDIFSLPLTLGLNSGGFRPFIGVEPYLKKYRYISKSVDDIESKVASRISSSSIYGASAIFGFQIPLSKRLALNTSYIRQFTLERGDNRDIQVQQLDVSIRYRLFKKQDK